MKIPYNRVLVMGDVLFAARGAGILSFSLRDGSHLSTWAHPSVHEAVPERVKPELENASIRSQQGQGEEADRGPPAKKQRLGGGHDNERQQPPPPGPDEAGEPASLSGTNTNGGGPGGGANTKSGTRNREVKAPSSVSRVPERPVVTQLTGTTDGKHVVATTAHDKVIWVFEHDGAGRLVQLTQRTMPKRPSSLLISPDAHIISADKFGDVYALPLVPDDSSRGSEPSALPRVSKPAAQPAASKLTVHSQRNLRALENQQRQMELDRKTASVGSAKDETVEPGLTLLLGHVSLLTAVALAESADRRYILTADRDEHIRVSRYMPQAHVIQGYCLGHEQFVSALVVPAGRPEMLVSGGGDPDLFVWDWLTGSLRSRASILSLAQCIDPETTKVAVSGLCSLRAPDASGQRTYVLAICESIRAIFSWELTDDGDDTRLSHPVITQLPGNPLDVAVAAAAPPKVIVSVDPGEMFQARSLHVLSLTLNEHRLSVESDLTVRDDADADEELDVTEAEVRRLLYTVENLRKQPSEAEASGPADADVVQEEAASL